MEETLYQKIETTVGKIHLKGINIPEFVANNLKYKLFDWQVSAFQYFLAYENAAYNLINNTSAPKHLMFNLATGTGKTLLMASLILHYYKKGYRHFLFFVNQNNIVGKTEENLINTTHTKYLFNRNIIINDKTVKIEKVNTFSGNSDNIQILFTSIHKLHNDVYAVKENCVYLEDLQKRNLIMLADEAHHFNADTKKKKDGQEEIDLQTTLSEKAKNNNIIIEKSWENTVIKKILNKDNNKLIKNENVLLEFTATIPNDKLVQEKYRDKIIYKFELKDFLRAGYTKEINLVSSSFDKRKRIIQALLFNWYRHKIALKNGIPNFKPVILFRSKIIEDSKRDFKEFRNLINNITPQDFNFINDVERNEFQKEIYWKGKSRILDIKHFIKKNKISWNEIIKYLQDYFVDRNLIITNSKEGTKKNEKTTEEQEKLLNSLEDKGNHIRAIFTVLRLTEGWDVLNLFDIVRLYEGQNTGGSNKGPAEATASEVQLIGRGVRYFPFKYEDSPLLKRKFDNNLEHELRVLEELYYHSDDEPRYLSELKNELKNKGYIEDEKKIKTFALKKSFKDGEFYKTVKLFLNEQIDNPDRKKNNLDELKSNFEFTESIRVYNIQETRIEMDKDYDTIKYTTGKEESKTFTFYLNQFEKHISQKAINIKALNDNSIFRFNKLKNELKIESMNDIFKDEFMGKFKINIVALKHYNSINDISNYEQLRILLIFFDHIERGLTEIINPYRGSEFFDKKFSEVFDEKKEKLVIDNEENLTLEKELLEKKWYALDSFNGTGEERNLIEFLKETMGNLESKYEQVFLLRNEEIYKIYDFEKGRGFQPDFLLFLKKKKLNFYYQVFIEPKGELFKDSTGGFGEGKEGWKEKFLEEISMKYGHKKLLKIENKDYKLIGLPLFNFSTIGEFKIIYKKELELD